MCELFMGVCCIGVLLLLLFSRLSIVSGLMLKV